MSNRPVIYTKILVTITLLFTTGLPFIWIHKTFLPYHLYLIISPLLFICFALHWRDSLRFKKKLSLWIMGLLILSLAVFRKTFIPPFCFKIYDFCLIVTAFALIYEQSRMKELLIFTSILITPLSLASLFGFLPSCVLCGCLLFLGLAMAVGLPRLQMFVMNAEDHKKRLKLSDITLIVFIGILIGIFSLLILLFPKGEVKEKRVLFDIGHESAESAQLDYNTDFRESAPYGHGRLVELLKKYGFEVGFVETITKDPLHKADILVLIMCAKPYTKEEIKSIREFVLDGGGLLVIGDHTDTRNTGSSLNPVIEEFGIRFRFDTLWIRGRDRINLHYRPHPTHFDLEKIYLAVGASLQTKYPARPIIQSSYAVYSDYGDPDNTPIHLGNSMPDKDEKVNDLTLIADSRYGNGRVFVLGDSTCFQNASIYANYLFAYRIFDWLNHKKGHTGYIKIILLVMIFFIIVLLIILFFQRGISREYLFAAIGLSLVLAVRLGGIINSKVYPTPKRLENSILIDLAHQNEYNTLWTVRTKSEKETSLDGLIAQIIRKGYHPVLKSKGKYTFDELQEYEALFIICPNTPFSSKEIEAIVKYCEQGGGVLLVEGVRKWTGGNSLWESFGFFKNRYPLSADNPILSYLGLPLSIPYGKFYPHLIPHTITQGISRLKMVNPCKIDGGLPIAFINRSPVISFKEFGRGIIVAIADDRIFANYMMDNSSDKIKRQKILFFWNLIDYLQNG